jgi:UDP:flavonoid glycosyltransferase YjiC (YdhE family)
MKFVLASWGSRGDVEPCVAVGRELLRRGHDVHMAVSPDLVDFAESTGLAAVAYGPDLPATLEGYRDFWVRFFRSFWRIRDLIKLWRELWMPINQRWAEGSTTLKSLADGADVLVTGSVGFEQLAANVAEYYDIPLATLHWFPLRANGQLLPFLPAPLCRSAMTLYERLSFGGAAKKFEKAQRRELGLPKGTGPWPRRIAERGALEIQAYDEVCFPGLAAEWAKWNGRRPFVGALTMELATDADDEVASWIAAGTPPICFGFGSIGVESAADTLAMIAAACARLGERALICAAATDFSDINHFDHVKVVAVMNYAAVFPACRAVVHHGGTGTTAAGLRAGVPTLILWRLPDQALWAARVKRLKVGTGRRLSGTTEETLVADLRTILAPQFLTRARELATRMTKPTASVAAAADVVENLACMRSVG